MEKNIVEEDKLLVRISEIWDRLTEIRSESDALKKERCIVALNLLSAFLDKRVLWKNELVSVYDGLRVLVSSPANALREVEDDGTFDIEGSFSAHRLYDKILLIEKEIQGLRPLIDDTIKELTEELATE